MNRDDPLQRALEALPDEPLPPDTAARIGRMARASFVRHASPLGRFDDLALGRVAPALLLGCSAYYLVQVVAFFRAYY